ncbi:hypothetical protein [Salirhabdus salicampi]|uniref:hypothetical protein n=1 Tax=Salirhabdus salicampi TaxID=476102 RepID=UPI0020C403A3|nr:hypothetical protein [Salirhabdus salicampi]MCP8616004.1 hypothetical protein [Salirhabdus salicampi]
MEHEIQDELFRELQELQDEDVLIITHTDQLHLFGQTFRPIFCGKIAEVELGYLTLHPVNIKLVNAPFFKFPIPLSIPLEKIAHFTTEFDCENRFPLA